MLSEQTGCKVMESNSPFQNLNEQFDKQNAQLDELVNRLRIKLHRLSDTNFPTAQSNQKEVVEELPFHDGYLKDYYHKLKNNNDIVAFLGEQVQKLESLI